MLSRLPLPVLMLLAALCYHAALWLPPAAPWLVMLSAAALCAMVGARTARRAFYAGIGAALLIYIPQLWFFFGIFKVVAIPLWLCLAVWVGIFCGTLHVLHRKWGVWPALLLAPVLWMGLEYFRSEVWLLRFSWLTPGYALSPERMGALFQSLGVYGSGALLVFAGGALVLRKKPSLSLAVGFLIPGLLIPGNLSTPSPGAKSLRVTGIQFEQAPQETVLQRLDAALAQYPDTGVFMLSEYTFPVTVPRDFTDWCRLHGKYLIAGGRDYAPGLFNSKGLRAYFNTAWVIGPEGTVVHRQAKSMPIQFFDDGMPAAIQQVWNSPWGRIGICICYDQNYVIVTDPLAAQDMQALLIPTMDVIQWGPYQHQLSARLAATRAAEYGVPVFRLASSGVSVAHDHQGHLLAKGSVPGQGEIISTVLYPSDHARHPWDRLPAKVSTFTAGGLVCLALALSFIDERRRLRAAKASKSSLAPLPSSSGTAP